MQWNVLLIGLNLLFTLKSACETTLSVRIVPITVSHSSRFLFIHNLFPSLIDSWISPSCEDPLLRNNDQITVPPSPLSPLIVKPFFSEDPFE